MLPHNRTIYNIFFILPILLLVENRLVLLQEDRMITSSLTNKHFNDTIL